MATLMSLEALKNGKEVLQLMIDSSVAEGESLPKANTFQRKSTKTLEYETNCIPCLTVIEKPY